jgi:DNA modification methylase
LLAANEFIAESQWILNMITALAPAAESSVLARFDRAKHALAVARTVDEVLDVRNQAEALRAYLRQCRESLETQNAVAEIKLRAERRAGELLAERDRPPVGRPPQNTSHDATYSTPKPPTLADLGITRSQSSRLQAVANIPEAAFEDHLVSTIKSGGELTTAGVLDVAKQVRRQSDRAEQEAAERKAAAKSDRRSLWTITGDEAVVPCDAIITDPPYGVLNQPWEPTDLKAFTLDWAGRWATCGADLIAVFWSQRFEREGRDWFDEAFAGYSFQQKLIWVYRNRMRHASRAGFKQSWEPVFLYRRNESTKEIRVGDGDWGGDLHDLDTHEAATPQTNFTDVDCKSHPAQKPLSAMRWLVNSLSRPGDLVVDPFCGSGTTGIAAIQLGRRFHGIDTCEEYRELAERRIACYGGGATP